MAKVPLFLCKNSLSYIMFLYILSLAKKAFKGLLGLVRIWSAEQSLNHIKTLVNTREVNLYLLKYLLINFLSTVRRWLVCIFKSRKSYKIIQQVWSNRFLRWKKDDRLIIENFVKVLSILTFSSDSISRILKS